MFWVSAFPLTRTFDNFGPEIVSSFNLLNSTKSTWEDPVDIAKQYISSQTSVKPFQLVPTSHHQSHHNVHHVYFNQLFCNMEISNGVANVNIKDGSVISFGHSLFLGNDLPCHPWLTLDNGNLASFLPKTQLTATDAVVSFLTYLGHDTRRLALVEKTVLNEASFYSISSIEYIISGIPFANDQKASAKLKWLQSPTAELELTWDIVVDLKDNWYNTQVDANDGTVLGHIDWISHATYRVFPLGTNDPLEGQRQLVVNPENPLASPFGWHTQGRKNALKKYNSTIGNNVYAQENGDGGNNWLNNYRPTSKKDVYDFPANFTKSPDSYLDAAITNLFYWNNVIHDLFYVYGFNEVSGNFQNDNFGRGGKPGDAVIANCQDGSGYNNANFATPPDGHRPRMRMYVWTGAEPYRDGDMEGGIIVHEYAHGISIRLTGGAENVNCLGWGESGGMGEGWGDTFATILRTNVNTTKDAIFPMGLYAAGSGIRKFPYSTSLKVNPSTYGYIRKPGYWGVHAKGEVWAAILYEVYWALVLEHGYQADWFDNTADKLKGNILALQLIVDGLKLQPCYPTFLDARNAIIQADSILTDGENYCLLWKAFAKRGLGSNARSGGFESFDVPNKCDD